MPITKKPGIITDDQIYLFHEGTNYRSYQMLGAHLMKKGNKKGAFFGVWAPNASSVSVVGDFNEWNDQAHPMERVNKSGVWNIFIPGIKANQIYKYAVGSGSGEIVYKADPYAYYSEVRPRTASVVYDIEGYSWKDEAWQDQKKLKLPYDKPMLIYEVHLGSWKRNLDGFLNYHDIADELVDYVMEMGYTHIELLPIMEHPFDGSWGYQVTGYYAATSRYGTPKDFMYLIDLCHQKGIGVILDWVPGHFPKDEHGLARFDGTSIYEHPDPRRGEHPQWGTLIFDYGRHEVHSFLISNIVFWLECFHADGFRVDAVTSILYLDYARDNWIPNKYGGRENLEAEDFLKKLNETVTSQYPGTLMIAEDSSQWPKVTEPVSNGGLGFTYKWNMGWMNDTLKYCSMDPLFRKGSHNLLTFSLAFAFSENYILPLSHDEVVHGKHSLLDKMPGDYQQKFAGLRSLYGYMAAHPGKKLVFMGGEYGQFIEWKYDNSLDWHLLDYDMHKKMHEYVKAINHFYLDNPCLWEDDGGWNGFQWISPDDANQSVIAFMRKGCKPSDYIITVINFTPVRRDNYILGVPEATGFKEIFNSDDKRFGGTQIVCGDIISPGDIPCHGFRQSIILEIPPLSAVFYKPVETTTFDF
ncbi:MAG: 1,4-alpha-glucan branching protein GlgB [Herbinix sp.]|nr:1,4-alpha-glucan branching protein GlgB [Herbinix sp.]